MYIELLFVSPSTQRDVHGLTNYYLLLYSDKQAIVSGLTVCTLTLLALMQHSTPQKPSWVLYFLDSGGGTYPELVYPDQIQWFIDTSSHLLHSYGHIPAIAFFHIPRSGNVTLTSSLPSLKSPAALLSHIPYNLYCVHTCTCMYGYIHDLHSTGYEGVYKESLCFGMNDDDVTPQIRANGMV